MNFKDAAKEIPDDWLDTDSVDYRDLFDFALNQVAMGLSKDYRLDGPPRSENDFTRLFREHARANRTSAKEAIENIMDKARRNAKILLFNKKFQRLLPRGELGELLYPSPFIAKLMGIPVKEVEAQIEVFRSALSNRIVSCYPEPVSDLIN